MSRQLHQLKAENDSLVNENNNLKAAGGDPKAVQEQANMMKYLKSKVSNNAKLTSDCMC